MTVKSLNQNRQLRERIKALEQEREEYRRAVHALLKKQITAEDMVEWINMDKDEGGSLLDVINELRQEAKQAKGQNHGLQGGLPKNGAGTVQAYMRASKGKGNRRGSFKPER